MRWVNITWIPSGKLSRRIWWRHRSSHVWRMRLMVDRSAHGHHRWRRVSYLLRCDLKGVCQRVLAHSRTVVLPSCISSVAVHNVAEFVEFWLFLDFVPRLLVVISITEAEIYNNYLPSSLKRVPISNWRFLTSMDDLTSTRRNRRHEHYRLHVIS